MRALLTIFLLLQAALPAIASPAPVPAADPVADPAPAPEADKECKDKSPKCKDAFTVCLDPYLGPYVRAECPKACKVCK